VLTRIDRSAWLAIQINAVVAAMVAARFTDGGSNEKQLFEIDGHR
jgi:hypothetical protein